MAQYKILNYTTEVDPSKSVGEITTILTNFGARSINTEFDDNANVSGITFVILVEGRPLAVRLPCNVDGVYNCLLSTKGVPASKQTKVQARRVAWRILKDWLEAQLALYRVGQAEVAQVLMPYAIDAEGHTAYEMFKQSHLKQLPAAPSNVVDGKFQTGTE